MSIVSISRGALFGDLKALIFFLHKNEGIRKKFVDGEIIFFEMENGDEYKKYVRC
jgi:hypothetical protein